MAVAGLAFPAHADELQNQLVAAARAMPREDFAFRRTIASEQTGTPRKVVIEQFDPRKPTAQRWTLVSVDGKAPTAQQAEQSRKQQRGPTPGYANLADWFGGPATRADGPGGTVIYRFAGLPKGSFKIGSHDASPDIQIEATVNMRGKTPFVERVRATSSKAFRVMLVASVQSLSVVTLYRQLADGHVVPAEQATEMNGSMLGKSGQIRTALSYGDFQPAR